jgi:hypothetical protein
LNQKPNAGVRHELPFNGERSHGLGVFLSGLQRPLAFRGVGPPRLGRLASHERPPRRQRPEPGSGKGMLTIVSEDDEHLQDFAEYMP